MFEELDIKSLTQQQFADIMEVQHAGGVVAVQMNRRDYYRIREIGEKDIDLQVDGDLIRQGIMGTIRGVTIISVRDSNLSEGVVDYMDAEEYQSFLAKVE